MDTKIKDAIEEYQCPGCVNGSNIECYEQSKSFSCKKHVPGTVIVGIGKIALGMPKGFNRVVSAYIDIFKKFDATFYNYLNVPVWKYLDENGNTIVRGFRPRIDQTFIHVFLENCIDKIDCVLIDINILTTID